VRAGLATARVAARIELLHHAPTVIVDGAHNEASVVALCDTLDQKWPAPRKKFVFGTTRGKDIRAMLRRVLRTANEIVLTQYVENPRSADPTTMAKLIETLPKSSCRIRVVPNPSQAWQETLAQACSDDLICVTGSLFLAAELRERMISDLSQRPALARV
jgi:dihydrofolate synthase/folylpolyglutamate synthase